LLRPPVAPADGPQLSLTPSPLAAPALDLRLSSSACTPALRWPTLRLGSVTCPRLGWRALPICIGAPRILPTFGDPSGLRLTILVSSSLHPTILVPFGSRRMALPPAWPTTYLRLASDGSPLARLAAAHGLRHMPPLLPRLAFTSGLLRLLPPSGFTGRRSLGLRLATASPVEPTMHSLFPPNLASPAEPSMSIPFPPARASSGITQLEQLPACAVFCNLWCVQRSFSGLRPRFHPLSGLTAILRFSPAVRSARLTGDSLPACADCVSFQLPATNSDALLGHQLKETLRRINLWIQVQKSS